MESRKPATEADIRRWKEQQSKLQTELQMTKQERDTVTSRMEYLSTELESLKLASQESVILKMKNEELKQVEKRGKKIRTI